MTVTTSSEDPFPTGDTSPEQRAWALRRAKSALTRGPFNTGEISTVALIDLANFILSGVDPYAEATTAVT